MQDCYLPSFRKIYSQSVSWRAEKKKSKNCGVFRRKEAMKRLGNHSNSCCNEFWCICIPIMYKLGKMDLGNIYDYWGILKKPKHNANSNRVWLKRWVWEMPVYGLVHLFFKIAPSCYTRFGTFYRKFLLSKFWLNLCQNLSECYFKKIISMHCSADVPTFKKVPNRRVWANIFITCHSSKIKKTQPNIKKSPTSCSKKPKQTPEPSSRCFCTSQPW